MKVNVVDIKGGKSSEEKPQDFYSYAADLIQKELSISNNIKLRNIKLDRSLIKKSVMTIPYNISLSGVGDQLMEHFKMINEFNKWYVVINKEYSLDNKNIYLTPTEFGNFTSIVFNVLTKKMPSLKTLTDYLNSLINILLKLNRPIVWITPAGLKITLSTIKYDNKVTQSRLIPNSKPVTISLPTNRLNYQKIQRSFMPNLIHSLDAANIHLLIRKIKLDNIPINSIYTIHDCFATTPNQMFNLEHLIKLAFIEIYFKNGNYIEKMHNHIVDQIKSYAGINYIDNNGKQFIKIDKKYMEIPNIPEQFISDKLTKPFIDGILNSAYFIR